MNKNKVLLIGLIVSLFLMGMVISQWTVAGVVSVMGVSSYQFASQVLHVHMKNTLVNCGLRGNNLIEMEQI
ncbi:hypothetical protein SOP93_13750 [Peribacillus frigoritolerans]|uniref:hypothetical protein n=1 Tax=Peribacillus frigoritolerans TaxID=450367 RepID=UPI002B2454AD|nr:hypothetical protein [Peribacillus frigoritolerans]MEB2492227.1 hypothetical protein [Peribacillus frigoritolerans]